MKKIAFSFCNIAIITIVACSNNTANKDEGKTLQTSLVDTETMVSDDIVGSWRPFAVDFNLDGKTEPSGKWVSQDPQKNEALLKEAGLTIDAGDFTFKANGTGFLGGKETADNAFTYKKMANGKYVIKGNIDDDEPKNTNAENIEEFYLDAKGQLIYHHSNPQLLVGKNYIQNSFELYRRK